MSSKPSMVIPVSLLSMRHCAKHSSCIDSLNTYNSTEVLILTSCTNEETKALDFTERADNLIILLSSLWICTRKFYPHGTATRTYMQGICINGTELKHVPIILEASMFSVRVMMMAYNPYI